MLNRSTYTLLLRPGLRSDFRDSYQAFETEWDDFLKSGTMDRPEIEATTLSGLPRQVELGEMEPYLVLDPAIAEKVTFRDKQFGLAVGVTQELMEDDQYGKVRSNVKWLGRSTKLTQEYEAASLLDDAFTGAVFTGMFGEALISATHTLLSSGDTWSNRIDGDPQLGTLGMQAAFELGETAKDQNGHPIPIKFNKFIINIHDQWMAMKLTMNEWEVDSMDRNINTIKKKGGLSYTVSHYKDQTAHDWFVQDTSMNDAHLAFRVKPEFPDWYEDRVRAAFFGSRQRFCVYFYDPRGWGGSNAT